MQANQAETFPTSKSMGNQKHHVKCDVASRIIETVVRLEVWLRNQGSPRALEYTAVGKS